MPTGVYAVDAVTGKKLWNYADPQKSEVISSPAIIGPPGKEVVAFATFAGAFQVLSLADGKMLYQYQTGGFVTASPAYHDGHFFITSADGFVYDFAAGGGNGAAPRTAITSPKPGGIVPNTGTVAISGTATDATGIAAVEVAVQAGGPTGNWYDAANNSFSSTGALTNRIATTPAGSAATTSVNWSIKVPVPKNGTILQVYANAVNVAQIADVLGAPDRFTVSPTASQPSVHASAVFIAPGASFTATGTGFNANEGVDFSVNGAIIGTVNADKTGNVTATLTLSKSSIFGVTPLTATGRTSKKSAFTSIDIANAWAQAAYAPEQTAFEPNDLTFQRTINPDYIFLLPAWYYQSGAPVESSPAVYNGTAFFGNDAGTLSAVDIGTGASIFSVTIPSGAAIRSTPAIDRKTGDLVFTADDGKLYLTTLAGTGLATVTIGGLPTSPNVHDGKVYVGSDKGLLTAIDETTGKAIWSNTLSAAIHAPPSVDTVTGKLVVGDDSGAISAFNAATGHLTWTVTTKGAITAAPSIVSGIVYDGSADGKLYAIDETTGTTKWTYDAKSPIEIGSPYDPVALTLYVAGPNGKVTAVNAADGTLFWVSSAPGVSSAFAGASAVNAFYLAEAAQGSTITYRTNQFGRYESNLKTGAKLNTAPAISSGAVYVGASDGGLYAYTPYGHPPSIIPATIRRAEAALVAAQPHAIWASAPQAYARFSWTGQRDVALHVDAMARTYRPAPTATALRYHGGPVVSAPHRYVVFWQPAGLALEKRYNPAVTAMLGANTGSTKGQLAGAFLDTTPYPAQMSDAALQSEIQRAIVVNRWTTDRNAQFIVLTGPGAVPAGAGFCSYHSAFAFAHDRSKLVPYAVVPYSGTVSACGAPAGFNPSGDAAIDAVTVNLARVTRELANDPLLNGWYDANGGEVGPGFAISS